MDLEQFDMEKQPRIIHKIKFGKDKFILVRNTRVHYVEAGKGEPVLLLPGSDSTYRIWNRLMPLLTEKFRVLALDYPGGDLGKPDRSLDERIVENTDLVAQMVQQMELGRVTLLGISLAGGIAFDFASRYSELTDKIVSIGGHITKIDDKKGTSRRSGRKIGTIHQPFVDIEEGAKSIKAPVLYLYGTKTDYREIPLKKNLEFLQIYLPHAWIVAMEGGIFEMAMQNPEELTSLILEFLGKN